MKRRRPVTVIILVYLTAVLLAAGIILICNNRPLWPGCLCGAGMLACTSVAVWLDPQRKGNRARAHAAAGRLAAADQEWAALAETAGIPPPPGDFQQWEQEMSQ